MTEGEPPRAVTPRSLDALVACPHCAGGVDVTVEVHRARVEMMNLLWGAFLENGANIETALWQLEADLLDRISEGTRSTGPIARFCRETSVPESEADAMAKAILRLKKRRNA